MDAGPRIFRIEPYVGCRPQIVCVDRRMGGIAVCEDEAVLELKIATLDPEFEMSSEKVTAFRRWTDKATLSERAPFWKLLAVEALSAASQDEVIRSIREVCSMTPALSRFELTAFAMLISKPFEVRGTLRMEKWEWTARLRSSAEARGIAVMWNDDTHMLRHLEGAASAASLHAGISRCLQSTQRNIDPTRCLAGMDELDAELTSVLISGENELASMREWLWSEEEAMDNFRKLTASGMWLREVLQTGVF